MTDIDGMMITGAVGRIATTMIIGWLGFEVVWKRCLDAIRWRLGGASPADNKLGRYDTVSWSTV